MSLSKTPTGGSEVTMDDVNKRMQKLGIDGWSSMGTFTPEDHMKHLDVIEALQQGNHKLARELSGGHGGATYHPDGRVTFG